MNREYVDQVINESCLLIPVKMKKIELEAQNSKLLDVFTFINGNKRIAFF